MVDKNLEDAFLQAAEIAKKLPKNLQEAGFNRALEQLLGKTDSKPPGGGGARGRSGKQKQKTSDEAERPDFDQLLDSIDRTAYPDVNATTRVADRALMVLQLAHQDHGVDGLTASEITTILSRKFRLPAKVNSVSKALEREVGTVDVRAGTGAARVFHIMAPGEAYLKELRSGEQISQPRRQKAKSNTAKGSSPKSGSKKKATSKKKTVKKKSGKKAAGRLGPKAAINSLIESDFFQSARGIAEIQEELRHRRGHSFSVQELSPALVRSVRDGSLARQRNDSGQYEYTQA